MRTSHRLAATLTGGLCLLALLTPTAALAADDPTPDPVAPVTTVTTSAAPTASNITYNRVADPTAVRIKWTAPDPNGIYTYTVRLLVNKQQQMQATTNTQLDVDDINPGDTVQAFITTTGNGITGGETAGDAYTQPDPAVASPDKVSLSQLSKTGLRVTWTPGDNKSVSYLVSLTGGNGASPKQVGGTSIDFTGLSAGYTYTASVTAVADDSGYQSLPKSGKKLTLDPDFGATKKPTPAPTVTITSTPNPSATSTVTATPTPTPSQTSQQPQPSPSATPATTGQRQDGVDTFTLVMLIIGGFAIIGIIICTIGLILDRRKRRMGPGTGTDMTGTQTGTQTGINDQTRR